MEIPNNITNAQNSKQYRGVLLQQAAEKPQIFHSLNCANLTVCRYVREDLQISDNCTNLTVCRYVAAIACLKKALYHDPFEWIISYNLGLVHLNTGQYASAFHYFSSSINLKPDFPSSYMQLGITLTRLTGSVPENALKHLAPSCLLIFSASHHPCKNLRP